MGTESSHDFERLRICRTSYIDFSRHIPLLSFLVFESYNRADVMLVVGAGTFCNQQG